MRSVACGSPVILSKNASISTDKPHLMMTLVKGITIEPVITIPPQEKISSVPSLSLQDMSKTPVARSSATQTLNPSMQPKSTQSAPLLISKATDSIDLIRLAHKQSMTNVLEKRDQMVYTSDLVKVSQVGTNTAPVSAPSMRSTACNTTSVDQRCVGITCKIQSDPIESAPVTLANLSRIPRPSPVGERKFVRQETFTVSQSSQECPAEKLLK